MTVEPIVDYIVIAIPESVTLDANDEILLAVLTEQAQMKIMSQYTKPPRVILVTSIEWLITSDPAEVERVQPAHDCPTCRAGNDQAQAFLKEFPDRRLALGNLYYTEVW